MIRIGLGCMRLSTDPARDEARAVAVIHAALDAGVALFDTADVYGLDEHDVGHNERLVARALASWTGDPSSVVIATKGGLRRIDGRLVPDGRARHLEAACDASLRALGVPTIALYQLHAPDPRTPLATSVRALAALQRAGKIREVGLCNVNARQIEEARAIVPIASVQVRLPATASSRAELVAFCAERGIRLLAHTPFGGPRAVEKIARDATLASVGARLGATPHEIALARLLDASPTITPLPGCTRVETARSCARAAAIALDDRDRAELAERDRPARAPAPAIARMPLEEGEVVIFVGYPGAGKSTSAEPYVARGYTRLNRDAAGGRLVGLLPALERGLARGERRFVLDNTYATRASRARVVEIAAQHGVGVRCVWMETSLEEAQVNAVRRMIERHGALPTPEDIARRSARDPHFFGPTVLFHFKRQLEPPSLDEGFAALDVVPFQRRSLATSDARAILVELDDVVWRSRRGLRTPASPDDIDLIASAKAGLARLHAEGWTIFGLSWQPAIAEGATSSDVAAAIFDRLRDALEVPIEIAFCPHGAGPPICWCRKPLPGLGVLLLDRHRLAPERAVHVGGGPFDRSFAERLGIAHVDRLDDIRR